MVGRPKFFPAFVIAACGSFLLPLFPQPAAGAPYSYTQPTTLIRSNSARLNGMAVPNGAASVAWFQWGTNSSYGQTTLPTNLGSGLSVQSLNASITGLVNHTTYHCRLVASNATGVTFGANQVFSTGSRLVSWGRYAAQQTGVDAVGIAGGWWHTLALKSDGQLISWGDSFYGQIPAGVSNVAAIASGNFHSLALRSNGTVVVWGDNNFGQTNVPAGLSNVIAIDGGYGHSLALKSDGQVTVWGKTRGDRPTCQPA